MALHILLWSLAGLILQVSAENGVKLRVNNSGMYKVEWNFNENVTEYTVNCSLRAGSTFHIASSDTVANKTELQRELSWFRSCNTLECCVIPELSDSDNERENSTQCTQDIIPTGGTREDCGNFVENLVTKISTAAVVIGVLVLVLATTAVTLVILFREQILTSDLLKSLRENHGQEDNEMFMSTKALELQDYKGQGLELPDYVDMEDGDRNIPPPPLRELPEIPDEIGFAVSVDVHSRSQSPTNADTTNSGAMLTAENSYPCGYTDTEKQAIEDGYLTRATYHQNYREMDEMYYNQEDLDTSQALANDSTEFSDPSGERPLLVTAVALQPVESIEGEVIERIDYENVTLTRTRIKSSESSDASKECSLSSADHDQDYLNMDEEGNQIWDQRAPNFKSPSRVLYQEDNLKPPAASQHDATSVKSAISYENFDPVHQCVRKDEVASHAHETDSHSTHDYNSGRFGEIPQESRLTNTNLSTTEGHGSSTHNTEAGIEEDLYVNVPTHSQVAPISDVAGSLDDEFDYENIASGAYQQTLV